MNYELAAKNIRKELKDYIVKNNIKSLVMGISGGIDSALCAALAKPVCDELNIPLIGRSIPIHTNKKDEIARAQAIGDAFCTNFQEMDLTDIFAHVSKKINFVPYIDIASPEEVHKDKIRDGNIKARLRMIYLYNLASLHEGMVLSTDNWTEYLLGFSTIMGDWGDFGMIQFLWKTEVYEMSKWLCENELFFNDEKNKSLKSCIECQATDGLGISNTDLDQLLPGWVGTSIDGYSVVDNKLKGFLEGAIPEINDPVVSRHEKTHFKRNWPITISREKVTDSFSDLSNFTFFNPDK